MCVQYIYSTGIYNPHTHRLILTLLTMNKERISYTPVYDIVSLLIVNNVRLYTYGNFCWQK